MSSELLKGLTVVVPAFNEAEAVENTILALKQVLALLGRPHEIIVVDDGSSDRTGELAASAGARVLRHPTNSGYGRSLLSGIEAAAYDTVGIVDADGTYPIERFADLFAFYERGFHMAVAARQGHHYDSSLMKSALRSIFRFLAEYTCGRKIPDINSGFRIFDRRPVLKRRSSLSTGFSFTTTITLLFMLDNLFVGYMPITYHKRIGKTKVRLLRDSLRSLQIIITAIAQFNPLKLYLLLLGTNALGNLLLAAVAGSWRKAAAIHSWILLFAWNTMCLILALMIVALALTKPPPEPRA